MYPGELTDEAGNSIPFRVADYSDHSGIDEARVYCQMLTFESDILYMAVYIDPEDCAAADPGVYTGSLNYESGWGRDGEPKNVEAAIPGSIGLTLTVPEEEPTVTESGGKTIKDYLLGALQPVGKVLYVWGGGWNDSTTIGLTSTMTNWYKRQDSSYDYKDYMDLSAVNRAKGFDEYGYVGWCAYQVMHQKSNEGSGYTVASGDVGSSYAARGWGSIIDKSDLSSCVNPYDFSAPVTADLVLCAKWTALSSGEDEGEDDDANAVTVDKAENGSVTAFPQYAAKGRTVTLTVVPDEGRRTDTLTVTDKKGRAVTVTEQGDGTSVFTMPASAVTVTAAFAADSAPAAEGCPKDGTCPVSAFADASPDAWYHDGVHWALDRGIMNGVSDTRFDPNGTVTRAMAVTMLWRLAGKPEGGSHPFADVSDTAWYAAAVSWAASAGAVNGTSETAFSQDAFVTREQLSVLLYRYAQSRGQGFTGTWYFPLDFKDAAEVSEWADEAMHWLTMNGVIAGMEDGTLAPQEYATRAQIAAMFRRFAAKTEK